MKRITKLNLISLGVLVALTGCSEPESATTYVEKAKKSIAENKKQEGVIELKNAIKIDPKSAEARFLLGQTYLNQGNGTNAAKEFERAKSLQYDKNIVVPLLARAYSISDQDQDVLDLQTEVETLTLETKNHYALYRVIAQIRSDKLEDAKETLSQAKQHLPDSFHSVLAEAYVAFAEQNVEAAQQLAELALTLDEKQPEALMLMGQIATVNNDPELASKSFQAHIEQQPDTRSTTLLLASSLLKEGKLEEAEKIADSILKALPNQPFANYIKAMVRIQSQDYAKASEHAELAIQNNFNQPNIRLVAGVSAFYLKNYEQAYYHLNVLKNYLPKDHFARRMLVVSQMELGMMDSVADTLEGIDNVSEDDAKFNSLLSYRLLQAGATEEAKRLMSKQASESSNSAEQLLREGVIKLMLNDASAMDSLKEAVELDPDLARAELAMAFAAVKSDEFDTAFSIATKWQEKYADKADGFNLESAVYLKQGDLVKTKALLEKGLSVEANNAYGLTQLAQIATFEGDNDKAKEYSEKALAEYPDNLKVVRLYFHVRQDQAALDVVKNAAERTPENVNFTIVHAEALLKMKRLDEALRVLNSVKPKADTPKFYWKLKVATQKQLGNINQLQTTLEQWRKINPYHIEHVIYLADVYVAKRNPDGAIRTLNQGLEKHPNELVLELAKMQVLLVARYTDDAKRLFQSIKDRIADETIKTGIIGRIALLEKDYPVAVEHLTTFYQAMPNERNAGLLAAALSSNNQVSAAIEHIEQHLKTHGESAQLTSVLGTLYLESESSNKALTVYETMAKQQPDNVIAINNTAWLYMEQGEYQTALNYVEQAYKLAPKVANIVDTYGQILFKSGQNRQALEKAKEAYVLSQGKDVDIALNYAEVLLANQRKNEASKILSGLSPATDEQQDKKTQLSAQL